MKMEKSTQKTGIINKYLFTVNYFFRFFSRLILIIIFSRLILIIILYLAYIVYLPIFATNKGFIYEEDNYDFYYHIFR
jgi:hypothetical protein